VENRDLNVSAIDPHTRAGQNSAPKTSHGIRRQILRAMKSAPAKFVLSVLAAVAAYVVRVYVTRVTGPLPPFVIFNPMVLAIALWLGAWYGITTTAVSALMVCYWVLPPQGTLRVAHSADLFALFHFCAVGAFTSILAEMFRRNHHRLKEHAVAEHRKMAEDQTKLVETLEAQAIRLRDTEQFLTTLVDFVPQMVWMCTPDGENVYFNKRWLDYTGLTLAESSGHNWSKPFHPEDQPRAWAAWTAAVSSGNTYEVEARLRAANGNYRWHLWRGMPVRSEDGAIERWFGTGTDIEDLKRADEELQLTKQRFELAIRPTPVSVFNQDLDLRLTWIYNPAPGFDPAHILGKRDSDFLERPGEAELIERIKRRAIATGEGQRAEITVHADGKPRVFELAVEPLRDPLGKITGVTCATIDITDRKQQDLLLRETLAHFRSIYSTTLEYIGILDTNGRLLDCNDAALRFAQSCRQDVVDRPFWEGPWFAHTPGMPQKVRAGIHQAANGHTVRSEVTLMNSSGTPMSFDFSLTPVLDASGKVIFIVPEAREINDLKRAQEALIRSEKLAAVGRLASSIAHEINNPLEAVTNVLYLARTHDGCPDAVRDYLDIADEELQHVAHVTRQTLGFYREAVSPITVPLTRIMDSAVDLHRRKMVERNATVRKQYRGDFHVTTIPSELRQVFSNLLANSLDALEPGGQVAIRASRVRSHKNGAQQLRIIVADNGSGVEPNTLEHIFEPLFTTKVATGSGLGLWVVRQLLEKHGGSIAVRTCTAGPHRGTSFTVTLPHTEAYQES